MMMASLIRCRSHRSRVVYVIWARVVGDVITVLCIEGERRALEVKRMEGKRALVREPLLLPRELRVTPARVPVRTPNRQTQSVRKRGHSASRTLRGSPEHECEEDRGREGERGANQ